MTRPTDRPRISTDDRAAAAGTKSCAAVANTPIARLDAHSWPIEVARPAPSSATASIEDLTRMTRLRSNRSPSGASRTSPRA